MPGVTIGKGSIIGAFSFVNANIPDGVLAYGVPAKVIRTLNDDEIIEVQQEEQSG
jgi:maltose O-acetyltransferase